MNMEREQSTVTGHRTIRNTRYPITDTFTRSGGDWVVTHGICNGISACSHVFADYDAALDMWESTVADEIQQTAEWREMELEAIARRAGGG